MHILLYTHSIAPLVCKECNIYTVTYTAFIQGNDRMVHKISHATSELVPCFADASGGEAHVKRSLNADQRKRHFREIEVG